MALVHGAGTSPRGWGEVFRSCAISIVCRNIPTWVGRSGRPRRRRRCFSEHPHVGGEKSRSATIARRNSGTSPRGWGEAVAVALRGSGVRNIPTWVGRSPRRRERADDLAEHPHVGGEKPLGLGTVRGCGGTSPRGWGEGRGARRGQGASRNIPTWVGRRWRRPRNPTLGPEHPHVGGEKTVMPMKARPTFGTSPRGWGEVSLACGWVVGIRNIPTWVGRRFRPRPGSSAPSEHPHVGGEKPPRSGLLAHRAGTSPRGWGEVRVLRLPVLLRRNIPTWVGRRCSPAPRSRSATEHPHVGGEKERGTWWQPCASGTSPRGWGEGFGF